MFNYILCFVCFSVVFGQECNDTCYDEVKNELKFLIEKLKNIPVVSNVPSEFDDINSLINKTELIIQNISNMEETTSNSYSIPGILKSSSENIDFLKNIIQLINLLNQEMDDLHQKTKKHNETVDTCSEANKLFSVLSNDTAKIRDVINAINSKLGDILKRLEKIRTESLDIKKKLQNIEIPDMFEKFACSSNLQKTFQDIIDLLKSVADLLKKQFEEIFITNLKGLKYEVDNDGDIIKDINSNLNTELPKSDVKVTEETRPTLEELKKQIKDLKIRILSIKLDKHYQDVLDQVKKEQKAILDEYEIILKHIFSKKTRQEVVKEIEKARETLDFLKQRDSIKEELESIKKTVDTLKDRGVCFVKEKITIEDRINA